MDQAGNVNQTANTADLEQQSSITAPKCAATCASRTPRRRSPARIPKPPNMFIIFRSEFIKAYEDREKAGKGKARPRGKNFAKLAAEAWATQSADVKARYEAKAAAAKAAHRDRYPSYMEKRKQGTTEQRAPSGPVGQVEVLLDVPTETLQAELARRSNVPGAAPGLDLLAYAASLRSWREPASNTREEEDRTDVDEDEDPRLI